MTLHSRVEGERDKEQCFFYPSRASPMRHLVPLT